MIARKILYFKFSLNLLFIVLSIFFQCWTFLSDVTIRTARNCNQTNYKPWPRVRNYNFPRIHTKYFDECKVINTFQSNNHIFASWKNYAKLILQILSPIIAVKMRFQKINNNLYINLACLSVCLSVRLSVCIQ